MRNLCSDASMWPIREVKDVRSVRLKELRAIMHKDFISAL
jgi:hypothetical protein